MFTMVTALLGLAALFPVTVAFYDILAGHLLPCPTIQPQPDVDINKLLGPWHLTLVLMDATDEDFSETKVCVSGEFLPHNLSTVQQVWTLQTADNLDEPVARVELPTTVVRPGVWSLQTPLGGELKAVVFESDPESYMLTSHCGWYQGVLVHLWTSAVTRSRVISPSLRHFLTSALEDHGFHSLHSKIISWHGC